MIKGRVLDYNVLNSVDEVSEFINKNSFFIVGCGMYGEMLGGHLNRNGVEWDGYVDKRGEGVLYGRRIVPYSEVDGSDCAFLISSFRNKESMIIELQSNGVSENKIFCLKDRKVLYDYCGMNNGFEMGEFTTYSYGEEDSDKTYMIMERDTLYEGTFSDMSLFLRGCEFAEKHGFIPVIDRMFFPSLLYQNYNHIKQENAWEYYFEQPCRLGLEDIVYSKKNVRRYNLQDSVNQRTIGHVVRYDNKMSSEEVSHWRLLTHKYFRPSKEMKEMISQEKTVFEKNKSGARVLGVSIREGLSVECEARSVGCAARVQPTIEKLIDVVDQYMKKWQCDKVFLACQFKDTIDKLKAVFGENVLFYTNRDRMEEAYCKQTMGRIVQTGFSIDIDYEKRQKDYIKEIYMLSMCDALVCGDSSGASMSIFLGDCPRDKIYFFEEGNFA